MKLLAAFGLLLVPAFARAASFKEFVNEEVVPFVDTLVLLFYALAFIFFLIGVVRFFFSQSDEGRKAGRAFVLWGLIGFVVLFGVWGFVKLLLSIIPQVGV